MPDPTRTPEHLTCAETAKLVRAALRARFGRVRFSVRSSTYSMGASIGVRWVDGPTQDQVRAVTDRYAGGRFDATIDHAYHVDHWLEPDGTATLAYSPGTQGSRGTAPAVLADPPGPDARLVSFGADHVFAERDLSSAFTAALEAELLEVWGSRERAAEQHRDPYVWDTLVWRLSGEREYRDGVMLPAYVPAGGSEEGS